MDFEEKQRICKQCIYSKHSTCMGISGLTCGTLDCSKFPPQIGEVVMHEGKEVKLCGCFMSVKNHLNFKCPVGNW